MTKEEVVALMKSSQSRNEWSVNYDQVKAAFGGVFPDWWYETIFMSRLYTNTAIAWEARERGRRKGQAK